MQLPEKRIVDFIKEHHVLTLATSADGKPWCANCFYIYLEQENCFVFTSDNKTKHVKDVLENRNVAGGIGMPVAILILYRFTEIYVTVIRSCTCFIKVRISVAVPFPVPSK